MVFVFQNIKYLKSHKWHQSDKEKEKILQSVFTLDCKFAVNLISKNVCGLQPPKLFAAGKFGHGILFNTYISTLKVPFFSPPQDFIRTYKTEWIEATYIVHTDFYIPLVFLSKFSLYRYSLTGCPINSSPLYMHNSVLQLKLNLIACLQ